MSAFEIIFATPVYKPNFSLTNPLLTIKYILNEKNSGISVLTSKMWLLDFACYLSFTFQVLQLSTSAKEDEIKKQYRKVRA